jgi:ribosomal protein S18 acetylase RimI-like enzyme
VPIVRNYRPGDEPNLVAVWNESYAGYAGLATHTVEYWRWSILSRPGMSADDVLVLETDGEVLGYAALWTRGTVLDFVVDPGQRPRARRAMIRQLLSALEERARQRGWDSIDFSLPASDRLTDKTLRAAAYRVERNSCFMVKVLNPQALLLQLMRNREKSLAALSGKSFLVTLTPGDDPLLLQTRLFIRIGQIIAVENVSDSTDRRADCNVQLSICALAEMIFCRATPQDMLRNSLISVDPPSRQMEVCRLLSSLSLDSRWHTPHSDTF